MLLHILWRMCLWTALFRLTIHACMTQNGWLLFMNIVFAYAMCIRWYPLFPMDKRSVDD